MVLIFENLYISPAPDFINPINPESVIFDFIKEEIEIVISLRPEEPLKKLYSLYELSFYNIPIEDFDIPHSKMDVIKFIQIIEKNKNKKIVVHCTAGRGRSGMMVALYLKYRGFEGKEAIKFLREKIPGAVETIEQEKYVLNFDFSKDWGGSPPKKD